MSTSRTHSGRVQAKKTISVSSSSVILPVATEASGSQSTILLTPSGLVQAVTPVPTTAAPIDTPPATPRSDAGDDRFTKEYIAEVPDLMTSQTLTWVLEPNEATPQQTIFMCKCGKDAQTLDLTLPLQVNYGLRKYPSRYSGGKADVANTPIYLGGSYLEDESYRWFHSDVYKLPRIDELRKNVHAQLAAMYEQHQRYLAVPTAVQEDGDALLQGPTVKAGELKDIGIDLATVVPAMDMQMPSEGKVRFTYKVMLPVMRGSPHTLLHGQTPLLTLFTNKLAPDSKSTPVKGLRVVEGLEAYLKQYNVIIKGRFALAVEVCTRTQASQGTRQPFRAGLLPMSAVIILLPKSEEDIKRWRESEGTQQVSDSLAKVLTAADTMDGQV